MISPLNFCFHEEEKGEGIEKNKIATTRKMLSKNYSIDEISDITGLNREVSEGMINSSDL